MIWGSCEGKEYINGSRGLLNEKFSSAEFELYGWNINGRTFLKEIAVVLERINYEEDYFISKGCK